MASKQDIADRQANDDKRSQAPSQVSQKSNNRSISSSKSSKNS